MVVSPEDKEFINSYIYQLFFHTIHTPQPESEFSIKFEYPWNLNKVSKNSNLIIISLDFPADSTGDLLMQRIRNTNNQHNELFVMKNLYANNQIICAINTTDAISMSLQILKSKEWILNAFRENYLRKIKLHLDRQEINYSLSDNINKLFGHRINIQSDYKIIMSDSTMPFIWIGRDSPYRWIAIHKSKKDKFENKNIAWTEIELLYNKTIPSITIDGNYKYQETIKYLNNNRQIMRGIYNHDESESGGPFFVYIFDTKIENEVILISGFVNYPGHEKLILLKQLEVIAFSIYKGDQNYEW